MIDQAADILVRTFDSRMMRLVQRWWKGRFGRLARRDIWLEHDEVWQVRARQGDGDSKVKVWTFPGRRQAEEMIQRLKDTGGDGWTDITQASAQSYQHRPERRA